MKIHCYFLLNIKHGALTLTIVLGAPAKYNYEAPREVVGVGGGGASLRYLGGLQLSSAGTEYNSCGRTRWCSSR